MAKNKANWTEVHLIRPMLQKGERSRPHKVAIVGPQGAVWEFAFDTLAAAVRFRKHLQTSAAEADEVAKSKPRTRQYKR